MDWPRPHVNFEDPKNTLVQSQRWAYLYVFILGYIIIGNSSVPKHYQKSPEVVVTLNLIYVILCTRYVCILLSSGYGPLEIRRCIKCYITRPAKCIMRSCAPRSRFSELCVAVFLSTLLLSYSNTSVYYLSHFNQIFCLQLNNFNQSNRTHISEYSKIKFDMLINMLFPFELNKKKYSAQNR